VPHSMDTSWNSMTVETSDMQRVPLVQLPAHASAAYPSSLPAESVRSTPFPSARQGSSRSTSWSPRLSLFMPTAHDLQSPASAFEGTPRLSQFVPAKGREPEPCRHKDGENGGDCRGGTPRLGRFTPLESRGRAAAPVTTPRLTNFTPTADFLPLHTETQEPNATPRLSKFVPSLSPTHLAGAPPRYVGAGSEGTPRLSRFLPMTCERRATSSASAASDLGETPRLSRFALAHAEVIASSSARDIVACKGAQMMPGLDQTSRLTAFTPSILDFSASTDVHTERVWDGETPSSITPQEDCSTSSLQDIIAPLQINASSLELRDDTPRLSQFVPEMRAHSASPNMDSTASTADTPRLSQFLPESVARAKVDVSGSKAGLVGLRATSVA